MIYGCFQIPDVWAPAELKIPPDVFCRAWLYIFYLIIINFKTWGKKTKKKLLVLGYFWPVDDQSIIAVALLQAKLFPQTGRTCSFSVCWGKKRNIIVLICHVLSFFVTLIFYFFTGPFGNDPNIPWELPSHDYLMFPFRICCFCTIVSCIFLHKHNTAVLIFHIYRHNDDEHWIGWRIWMKLNCCILSWGFLTPTSVNAHCFNKWKSLKLSIVFVKTWRVMLN